MLVVPDFTVGKVASGLPAPERNHVALLDDVHCPGIQAQLFPPLPKPLESASQSEDLIRWEWVGMDPGRE